MASVILLKYPNLNPNPSSVKYCDVYCDVYCDDVVHGQIQNINLVKTVQT